MYRGLPSAEPANLPVATDIANKVICLPIFPELPDADLQNVVKVILGEN